MSEQAELAKITLLVRRLMPFQGGKPGGSLHLQVLVEMAEASGGGITDPPQTVRGRR